MKEEEGNDYAFDLPVETMEMAGMVETDYQAERGKPMPNRIHGTIQNQIGFLLKSAYADRYQFPSELSLATTPPSTPDICIYPKKKLDRRFVEAKETEMPLTTIEILSPSQAIEDLQHKAWDIYFPAGVKSAWVVVPELKVIQVLTPGQDDRVYLPGHTLQDPATGVEMAVDRVFEDLI